MPPGTQSGTVGSSPAWPLLPRVCIMQPFTSLHPHLLTCKLVVVTEATLLGGCEYPVKQFVGMGCGINIKQIEATLTIFPFLFPSWMP